MNDNAVSNIKQILTSFDKFVNIFENTGWVAAAKAEDIKVAFKLACFLEKAVAHFKSKSSLSEFTRMLEEWWKTKTRTKVYSEQFFQFACDRLLEKFFKTEGVMEVTLDIAVRIYTSIFPKERLENFLSELLLTSSSYQAIASFAVTVMDDYEKSELECYIKLTHWASILESGEENIVREEVATNMSLYKIESTLNLLIGILSLGDVQDAEKTVQNIILDGILQKMLDRSVLSKTFWVTLFKRVEINYVCKASSNFEQFLVELLNFTVYLGSMMKKKDNLWLSDPVISLCPEISYNDLLLLIKSISSISSLEQSVVSALNEAKEHTESSIWDEIGQHLKLL